MDAAVGQVEEIVSSVVLVLTATYNVVMSVAFPAVVLHLKRGIKLLRFVAMNPSE